MKRHNLKNYAKHKAEVEAIQSLYERKSLDSILDNPEDLILANLPLVERVAKGFSTSEQASGILSLEDLIQEGYEGLIAGVNNLEPERIRQSSNPEWSIQSFLYKRVRGAIRRAIDQYRGSMRIPEYKIREIRDESEKNEEIVSIFFNSIFDSLEKMDGTSKFALVIEDKSEEYDVNFVSKYLLGLISSCLTTKEAKVITSMYGLDGEKLKGYEIAKQLGMNETTMYRELNNLKESGMKKLVEKIDPDLVVNFLNG